MPSDLKIESRLSECAAIHLERIGDGLKDMENQISGDKKYEKKVLMLRKTISEIEMYASKIRDEQSHHEGSQ